MSPNQLEFDQAVDELKREGPSREQRERTLRALLNRSQRAFSLTGLAIVAAALFALLLPLFAGHGGGLAWAEVLRRTKQAANMHLTYVNDKGDVTGEQWRSGSMWALWIKDKSGRIVCEDRSDNSHFYMFLYRPQLTAQNAVQYATLWNKTPQMLAGDKRFADSIQTIDDLMNSKSTKLVSQERAEVNGISVQRYVLRMYGKDLQTVDADPKTGRILFVLIKGGETERLDYPDSIDPKLFSYRSRLTRDVAVLDLRGHEDPRKEPMAMPKVIASKAGIQLRGVSIGEEGDLFVNWTGYPPAKGAAKRLQVVGVKTGKTKWLGYYKDGVHAVSGPRTMRLVCYRVEVLEKLGEHVTVRIPTGSSYVEFKGVPVGRLRPLKE